MSIPRGWIEVSTIEKSGGYRTSCRRLILASKVGTILPEWENNNRDQSLSSWESSVTIDGQRIHVCLAPEALAEAVNRALEAGVNGLDRPSDGPK